MKVCRPPCRGDTRLAWGFNPRRGRRPSTDRQSRHLNPVPRAQHPEMVLKMAGEDESQRPHGDRVRVGHTDTSQILGSERAEEQNVCAAEESQLLDQGLQRAVVEAGIGDVEVLIETGKWSLVAAAESESAIAEDPFRVDQVADDLSQAPTFRARSGRSPGQPRRLRGSGSGPSEARGSQGYRRGAQRKCTPRRSLRTRRGRVARSCYVPCSATSKVPA
jgi:hypothetical protein